jgi:hypothetical protein
MLPESPLRTKGSAARIPWIKKLEKNEKSGKNENKTLFFSFYRAITISLCSHSILSWRLTFFF